MKNARPKTTEASARVTVGTVSKFAGTDNPRHLRVIRLLMIRPVKREELDKVAGCSNGPELVAELRRRGLEIPCTRVTCLDRDGKECRPGIYHLTDKDRRILAKWLRNRSSI